MPVELHPHILDYVLTEPVGYVNGPKLDKRLQN